MLRLYPSKTQIFIAEQNPRSAGSFVTKSLTTKLILNCEKESSEGKKTDLTRENNPTICLGGKDAMPRETGRNLNVFYNCAIGMPRIDVKD